MRRERALKWATKNVVLLKLKLIKNVVVRGKVWRRQQRCTKRGKKTRNLFCSLIIILSVMWADDFYSNVDCGVGELFYSSDVERHLLHRRSFFFPAPKKVKTKNFFLISLQTGKCVSGSRKKVQNLKSNEYVNKSFYSYS